MRRINTESTLFCLILNVIFVGFTGIYTQPTSPLPYIYQGFLLLFSNWLWGRSTLFLGGLEYLRSKITRIDYNDDNSWRRSVKFAVLLVFFPPLALGGILWCFLNELEHDIVFASLIVATFQVTLTWMGFFRPLSTCILLEEALFDPPLFKREKGEEISSWEFLPRPIVKTLKNMKKCLRKSKFGRFIISILEAFSRLIGSPL